MILREPFFGIAMNAVFADPRMQRAFTRAKKMPFDGKRLIFGGFKAFIE